MWWGWSKTGHLALDIIGLVPAFGEAADLTNGRGKCAEGNIMQQTGWDVKDVIFNRAAAYQRTPGGKKVWEEKTICRSAQV